MYERSAIVLERYLDKILKFNKEFNLKKNNQNYAELIEEIENYQGVTEKELEIIQEFDDTAKEIERIQQEQEKIYRSNKQLEDERAQLFTELGEEAEVLDIKLKKIEVNLNRNNEKSRDLRAEFVKNLTDFSKKQKNRNKCEKARRIGEANHISYLERMNTEFKELDVKDVVTLKDFINFEKEQVKEDTLGVMIKNGKNERVAFNQDVLKRAIKVRISIAEREAECYIAVYDKMKKLLAEQDTDTLRLNKYKKTLRDTSVKLAFLNAQREYVVGFLDYERMTAISGAKAHQKMMIEACKNFETDIIQIEKLYELVLRETNNRSTKKGYNQLYNKNYLKKIEDKEKNFEQEVNNVNISMGTVINSNYWRIEGIKNIYNVFQAEVSQKFNRDLSEYQIDEVEENRRASKTKKEETNKTLKHKEQPKFEEKDNYQETYDEEEIEEYEDDYEDENNEEYEEQYETEEIDEYEEEYEEDEIEYEDDYEEEIDEYEDEEDEYELEEEIEDNEEDSYEYEYEDEYEEEIDEYEEEEEDDDYKLENYKFTNKDLRMPINRYEEDEEDEYEDEEIDEYSDNEYEDEIFEEEDDEEENNNYKSYNNYNNKKQQEKEPQRVYQNQASSYIYNKNNYEEEAPKETNNYIYNNMTNNNDNDDDADDYKAYNVGNDEDIFNDRYRNAFLEDDGYQNVYQYNYDDDEDNYRKQPFGSKTVISFDDEESIDMIIANSRRKSTANRRNTNKGIFNKLFKK